MLLIDALKAEQAKDSQLTLQKFAFKAFEQGRKLYSGTTQVKTALDLFQMELNRLSIDAPIGSQASTPVKTAAPTVGGGMLFNQPLTPVGPECPLCQS